MPTTTYTDATFGARNIGARTDSTPSGVTDLSAEEDRYSQVILAEGIVVPTDGYLPASGGAATWDVDLGSGVAKADYAAIAGDVAGQGNYLVRMAAATETVTIDPADGSNPRIDEIYLVVTDGAYDSGSHYLPRFGYRKGDAAASPSAPGPDASWDAELLLATVDVPSGVADIEACTITDERVGSGILFGDGTTLKYSADDAILDTPTGGTVRIRINGTDELTISATEVNTGGNDIDTGGGDIITGAGLVDGVDVSDHDARHQPGGADAIATAAAGTIQPDDAAAEGSATSVARSDHQHAVAAGTPISLTPDGTNAEGTGTTFARNDHKHATPAAAAVNIGTANSEGSSSSFARADHVHRIANADDIAIKADRGDATSGTTITGSYVDKVALSFTMPSGWNTAFIMAWGGIYVRGANVSNNIQVRVEIGSDTNDVTTYAISTQRAYMPASHTDVVSGNVTVAIASKGTNVDNSPEAEIGTLQYIAIRAS